MAMHGPMSPDIRKERGQTVSLDDQVSNWPAPSVMDTADGADLEKVQSRREKHKARRINGNGFGESLSEKAQVLTGRIKKTWPAPAARDHKGANSAEHLQVSSGSLHLDQLPNFVEHVYRLPSSPDHPTIAGGSPSSTDGPNSNHPSVKRKLNPIFVEALMRWPTGLSGFARPEMALIQWRQRMHICLSTLCSPRTPDQGSLL
jgi:hypothetical protein